MSKIFN